MRFWGLKLPSSRTCSRSAPASTCRSAVQANGFPNNSLSGADWARPGVAAATKNAAPQRLVAIEDLVDLLTQSADLEIGGCQLPHFHSAVFKKIGRAHV